LQYHLTGTKSYYLVQDLSGAILDYSETQENLKIHKICLPQTLGYVFKLGKLQPSFYLGMTPNFIFSCSIDHKQHNHYRISNQYPGVEDDYYETKILLNPQKLITQFCVGFSTSMGQHFKINLNYNLGHNYYTNRITYNGNYSHYTYTENISIPSSDYIVSMQYKFNRPERNNQETKKD